MPSFFPLAVAAAFLPAFLLPPPPPPPSLTPPATAPTPAAFTPAEAGGVPVDIRTHPAAASASADAAGTSTATSAAFAPADAAGTSTAASTPAEGGRGVVGRSSRAAVIGGGRAPVATPVGRWGWPVSPHRVVRGFFLGPTPWSPGHRGVDLAAPDEGVVRAPATGTVRYAGILAGRGVLSIDHGGGVISSFEPVAAGVHPGDVVRRGERIAVLTPTLSGHCGRDACLHWGVRRHGRYVDPLEFVAGRHGPAVLLPLGSP